MDDASPSGTAREPQRAPLPSLLRQLVPDHDEVIEGQPVETVDAGLETLGVFGHGGREGTTVRQRARLRARPEARPRCRWATGPTR